MADTATIPVSVVIPCFQCAATIGRAVQSILQQSERPAEVIFVDDASGDETSGVLKQLVLQHDGWLKLVELSENHGAGYARNAGWNIASQPYIAFLDADDSWHPSKLAIQYNLMLSNPLAVISGHRCAKVNGHDLMVVTSGFPKTSQVKSLSLLFKNSFNTTTTVMLKQDLNFRFVDNKRYAEDFYLWQQIAFSGLFVMFIDESLSYVHKAVYGEGGLSANLWAMEKGELDNFYRLYQNKQISFVLFFAAASFSLIKYSKRLIVTKLWVKNGPTRQF